MDEVEAGRELDALVAERVMGLTVHQVRPDASDPFHGAVFTSTRDWLSISDYYHADNASLYEIPYYSTDIAAAWQVVEKLDGKAYWWSLSRGLKDHNATFSKGMLRAYAYAPTAPLAICRAALEAVSQE